KCLVFCIGMIGLCSLNAYASLVTVPCPTLTSSDCKVVNSGIGQLICSAGRWAGSGYVQGTAIIKKIDSEGASERGNENVPGVFCKYDVHLDLGGGVSSPQTIYMGNPKYELRSAGCFEMHNKEG